MSKVRDFNLFSDIFILNFILLQNMFILKKISNIFKLKFILKIYINYLNFEYLFSIKKLKIIFVFI